MSIVQKLTEGIVNRDLAKEGAALINSPTRHSSEVSGKVCLDNSDRAAEGSAISFTVASNVGAAVVHIVTDGDVTGGWDGTYIFYISWLFDGGCETGLIGIGTDTFSSGTLRLNPSLCHTNAAPLGGDKRIEGARIYFRKSRSVGQTDDEGRYKRMAGFHQ